MALWLIALGEGACLPRRLVYVVDRRAVVDQATRFAERLRSNLPTDLADRLGLRLRDGKPILPISTLRGGFVDNRDWLDDPSRPALLVGTVDMIGSRLLFEGYGVSKRRGMRPFQAGLLGVDTLVLLDEAHLCAPFERLLRQIEAQQHSAFGPADEAAARTAPPFRLMSLSATGRTTVEAHTADVFRLAEEDGHEPIVRQRLTARKRMKVIELDDPNELPARLAERAVELGRQRSTSDRSRASLPLFDSSGPNDPARVLVYCHRRADAIKVKALIDKACGLTGRTSRSAGGKGASELLVGERRVYERRALEQWLERHGFLGGPETAPVAPTFLVATSAGEVGVDLDADHMVCDLVAYERMVQRLGRVNRRGGDGREALIDVLATRPQKPKSNASKTVRAQYEREHTTFEARLEALRTLPVGSDDRYDASPAAAGDMKTVHRAIVDRATTPAPLYPALTRPLVDAWSMTSLKRHEGRPAVGPWLRGWEEQEEVQTTVLWRTHLPRTRAGADTFTAPRTLVNDFFHSAPPHASEKLEALRSHVLDWAYISSDEAWTWPGQLRTSSLATKRMSCWPPMKVCSTPRVRAARAAKWPAPIPAPSRASWRDTNGAAGGWTGACRMECPANCSPSRRRRRFAVSATARRRGVCISNCGTSRASHRWSSAYGSVRPPDLDRRTRPMSHPRRRPPVGLRRSGAAQSRDRGGMARTPCVDGGLTHGGSVLAGRPDLPQRDRCSAARCRKAPSPRARD